MSFMENALGGSGQQEQFSREEGFIGMMLAIIAADGHISNEEVIDFHANLKKATIMKNVGESLRSKMIDKTLRVLKSKGMGALLQYSADGLTPDLYEGVFATACDMVFSDGNVDPDEVKVMDAMKDILKISDDFAAVSAEVLKAKASV